MTARLRGPTAEMSVNGCRKEPLKSCSQRDGEAEDQGSGRSGRIDPRLPRDAVWRRLTLPPDERLSYDCDIKIEPAGHRGKLAVCARVSEKQTGFNVTKKHGLIRL